MRRTVDLRTAGVLCCIIALTAAAVTLAVAAEAWAAPMGSPQRQSVPTRTPRSGERQPTGQATPFLRMSTPTPIPTLPSTVDAELGGGSIMAILALWFLALAGAIATFAAYRRSPPQ